MVVVTSNQKRKQTGKIKKPKWKQKVKKRRENTLLPHPAGAEKAVVCADEVGRVIMASADH